MDASTRLERIRNRTIATWNNTKPAYKHEQTNENSNQLRLCRVLGDLPFFVNGKPEDLTMPPTPEHYSLDEAIFIALHDLFVYEAAQNLGPTKCSRINYLWFASLAQAYNWIQGGPITGLHDGWNWDTRYLLSDSTDIFLWMNRFLIYIMPFFIPGYSGNELLKKESLVVTAELSPAEFSRIQQASQWSLMIDSWSAWWASRQNDGFTDASLPPPNLPNGTQSLNVSTNDDDPNTFPFPYSWTPLKIGEKTQTYLTYNWKSVLSTGLLPEDETSIEYATNALSPTESERISEIAEIVQITANLTDLEKVTAEFWAGGPYTVSPPGMCIWFWKEYIRRFNISHTKGFHTLFYSGLDLAIHIFETGRLVWGLKKTHMQARPIQDIRRMYRGQTLTGYDGKPISGELWVPYQEVDFVTPPFADFPSGHSAFSQSFALVMTDWFGPSIPTSNPMLESDISLLSPVFATAQTNKFGEFTFPAGASLIQTGIVPAQPIVLSWTSWQQMADSAGISRKYGGIHATSAHTSSQVLANSLHNFLRIRWFSP